MKHCWDPQKQVRLLMEPSPITAITCRLRSPFFLSGYCHAQSCRNRVWCMSACKCIIFTFLGWGKGRMPWIYVGLVEKTSRGLLEFYVRMPDAQHPIRCGRKEYCKRNAEQLWVLRLPGWLQNVPVTGQFFYDVLPKFFTYQRKLIQGQFT